MAIRRMTLEEIRNLQPATEAQLAGIRAIREEDIDLSDIPELTPEQLAHLKPAREVHPEWFDVKPKKQSISIRLDKDVLEAMKQTGAGWQTRANSALRKAIIAGEF